MNVILRITPGMTFVYTGGNCMEEKILEQTISKLTASYKEEALFSV